MRAKLIVAGFLTALMTVVLPLAQSAAQSRDAGSGDADTGRICRLIEEQATAADLPEALLARLLWNASAFEPSTTSSSGTEGIGRFPPSLAEAEHLSDSFDIGQAIPAAASRIAELRERLGNLGLAVTAYHAGEEGVLRWLRGDGFLPGSTMHFVREVTGENPEAFRQQKFRLDVKPLETRFAFAEACRRLPLIASGEASTDPPADMPWAVVVGAGVDLDSAMDHWKSVKERTGMRVAGGQVYIAHLDGAKARRNRYSVRIGARTRGSAQAICSELRGKGGACMVTKNR
jgi:transglycosylase-like protein with SLT domain